MRGKDPDTLSVKLLESYNKLLKRVELWRGKEPGVEVLYVNYRELLENPTPILSQLEKFLGVDLDKEQMMTCIDKKLYRNRAVIK